MADSLNALIKRRASWLEVVNSGKPRWLADGAPRIVAELEAEIVRMQRAMGSIMPDVIVDRGNDRIEGDVGL